MAKKKKSLKWSNNLVRISSISLKWFNILAVCSVSGSSSCLAQTFSQLRGSKLLLLHLPVHKCTFCTLAQLYFCAFVLLCSCTLTLLHKCAFGTIAIVCTLLDWLHSLFGRAFVPCALMFTVYLIYVPFACIQPCNCY